MMNPCIKTGDVLWTGGEVAFGIGKRVVSSGGPKWVDVDGSEITPDERISLLSIKMMHFAMGDDARILVSDSDYPRLAGLSHYTVYYCMPPLFLTVKGDSLEELREKLRETDATFHAWLEDMSRQIRSEAETKQ